MEIWYAYHDQEAYPTEDSRSSKYFTLITRTKDKKESVDIHYEIYKPSNIESHEDLNL